MPAVTTKRILILQGHPDTRARHLCHALEDAYAAGAEAAGHTVRRVNVAALDFPLLRSQAEWEHGVLPAVLAPAQANIAWAQHLVLLFPLWLGDMPAVLKGFLEQVARPGFAFTPEKGNPFGGKGLTGGIFHGAALTLALGVVSAALVGGGLARRQAQAA